MTRHETIAAASDPFGEDIQMIRAQLRRLIETEVKPKGDLQPRSGR